MKKWADLSRKEREDFVNQDYWKQRERVVGGYGLNDPERESEGMDLFEGTARGECLADISLTAPDWMHDFIEFELDSANQKVCAFENMIMGRMPREISKSYKVVSSSGEYKVEDTLYDVRAFFDIQARGLSRLFLYR